MKFFLQRDQLRRDYAQPGRALPRHSLVSFLPRSLTLYIEEQNLGRNVLDAV